MPSRTTGSTKTELFLVVVNDQSVVVERPRVNGRAHLECIGLVFVDFRVALEVVNVDARQTRNEEFKFLFVEDGNESLGNDAVEAVQEGSQLLFNGPRHLHLTHKFDVFFLVFLRHSDVSTILFQVSYGSNTKFLYLWRET